MKKIGLFLFSLHVASAVYAKKIGKNEIGLGIGQVTYLGGVAQEDLNSRKFIFANTRLQEFDPPFFSSYGGLQMIMNQSYSLPALYYLRTLSPHLSFNISYQYSKANGFVVSGMTDQPVEDDTQIKSVIKNNTVQIGFMFTIFKTKWINPTVGIGIDYNIYTAEYFRPHAASSEKNERQEESFLLPYWSPGFSFKLTDHFSFRYEGSLLYDFELILFRPINRLSVNYQF